MSDRTDEQLVAAWVDGDRAAFDELVRRYERRVYAICYRYFGNATDAEDAAQDAFVALFRRAHTYAGGAAFSTWLYRVAVNACNDLARKRGRRPKKADVEVGDLAETLASSDDLLERRELALELRGALDALDAETREAIVLHDVQGVPYADIAALQGVAVGTVKSRVHRGHGRLAALLVQLRPDSSSSREPTAPSAPPTT
jgi:RNA polymerase sigma-70 factor (ECF subfamily)